MPPFQAEGFRMVVLRCSTARMYLFVFITMQTYNTKACMGGGRGGATPANSL